MLTAPNCSPHSSLFIFWKEKKINYPIVLSSQTVLFSCSSPELSLVIAFEEGGGGRCVHLCFCNTTYLLLNNPLPVLGSLISLISTTGERSVNRHKHSGSGKGEGNVILIHHESVPLLQIKIFNKQKQDDKRTATESCSDNCHA